MLQQLWYVKEPTLLEATNANHRYKCSSVTVNGDNHQIGEKKKCSGDCKQTNKQTNKQKVNFYLIYVARVLFLCPIFFLPCL
jgi:hypothetical protein